MAMAKQVLLGLMLISEAWQATAVKPEPDAPCSDICACIARAQKRLNLYEATYSSAASRHRANHETYNKLIVAAAGASPSLKRKILPMIAAGGEVLEDCADHLDKLLKQTLDLTEGVNQLTRSWKLMHSIVTANRKFKVTAGGGNPFNALPTPTTLTAIAEHPCPTMPDTEDLLKIDAATEEKQPLLPEQEYALKLVYKCTHNGAASCHDTQMAQNGFIELDLTGGKTNTIGAKAGALGTTLNNGINLEVTPLKLTGELLNKVNANFTAAQKLLKSQACSKDLKDYSTLSNTQLFGKLAAKALLRLYDKEATAADDKQAQAAINEAYGQTGDKLATNVWKLVDNVKVPVTVGAKEQSTPLNSVTTMRQLGDSVARLLLKELKSEEEKETKNKNAEEELNKECSDKKGTKCTGDCELDGEICKPKKKGEGENKEKTGTTNTTGSNSFVVNKAHLLLAFFH
uniref:Variant surface glycoprotein n=1 Tax=Trypanosoma brucei TaxID=5691 RepID=A0A1V0FY19_9TRYP|nr:variant surface glycoprotein [Trypanosoma brucei]